MAHVPKSNCCLGVRVDFYYALCPKRSQKDHLDAAVDALWSAIERKGERAWNPHSKAMARAEFRDRLVVASEGELIPVDHIKAVGDGRCHLYEIRWIDIPIAVFGDDHQVKEHTQAQVRLIHTEPHDMGISAVALHAHEKVIDGERTHAFQDAEVAEAERLFDAGHPHKWGISQR